MSDSVVFDRVAGDYDATRGFPPGVEEAVADAFVRAGGLGPASRLVEVGVGTGRIALPLAARVGGIVGIDRSAPMLAKLVTKRAARPVAAVRGDGARPRSAGGLAVVRGDGARPRSAGGVAAVRGDGTRLPLADASVDAAVAVHVFHLIPGWRAVLAELARVLRPGGLLLFSTFGPDTLIELREAFARVDDRPHVSDFAPIQAVGDALSAAGFKDPVIDRDEFNLTYADVPTLMRELRAIGANNAASDRHRGLTGKARMQAVFDAYAIWRDADGRLPSTWEVINAHAWGPQPGQPRRGSNNGEIATFPADRIPIRRRAVK